VVQAATRIGIVSLPVLLAVGSEDVVNGVVKATEGRSDNVLLILVVLALIAGIYYLQFRSNTDKDKRQEDREKEREKRDADKATKDSESLSKIADGMKQCGEATATFARIAETIEANGDDVREGMLFVFLCMEAFLLEDKVTAKSMIIGGKRLLERRARTRKSDGE
jgi:hypothetical protein